MFHYAQRMKEIRAIIREKRKLKQDYSVELKELYEIAAHFSFIQKPYEHNDSIEGYGLKLNVPYQFVKMLKFNYQTLGYEKLSLLNKTDKKWLVAAWGEPQNHTWLYYCYQDLWWETRKLLFIQSHMNRLAQLYQQDPDSVMESKKIFELFDPLYKEIQIIK